MTVLPFYLQKRNRNSKSQIPASGVGQEDFAVLLAHLSGRVLVYKRVGGGGEVAPCFRSNCSLTHKHTSFSSEYSSLNTLFFFYPSLGVSVPCTAFHVLFWPSSTKLRSAQHSPIRENHCMSYSNTRGSLKCSVFIYFFLWQHTPWFNLKTKWGLSGSPALSITGFKLDLKILWNPGMYYDSIFKTKWSWKNNIWA